MSLTSPKRKFAMFALAALVVLGVPSSVSAHAQLESSSPVPSAILEKGPSEIVLDFDEPITPVPRSIEIYDQTGNRLILEEAKIDPSDDTVMSAGGVPELPDGVYAVVWRALSSDGHVAEGAYTFQVGTSATSIDPADLLTGVLDGSAGPTGLSWVMGISRWVGYLGVVVLLGGIALLAGGGITSRRSKATLVVSWCAAMLGSAALFALQGPYAVNGSWGDVFDTGLWGDVADTRLGTAIVIRLGLLGVVAVLLSTLRGRIGNMTTAWWRSSVALVGAGVVLTFAASGHPSASPNSGLAVAFDAVHLGAISLWFGGLTMLIAGSVLAGPDARIVVGRFSRVATWTLPLIVVTGVWQTWHLIPRIADITNSDWGKGLLIKSSIAIVAITLGGFGRWLVRQNDLAPLRRLVAVELSVGVLVFAVTAGMVAKSPEVPSESTVVELSLVEGDLIADVAVTPAQVGYNEIHLTITTPNGALQPVEAVEMRMTLAGSEIPAISVPVDELGPNHFVGSLSIVSAGTWTLELLINPDPSTSVRLTSDVVIAG